MKIKVAVLSPVAWRTPPRHYGPWEQVASNVAEGMVKKGLDVTLFATLDSVTGGKLEGTHRFDIIHNHFDFLPLTYSRLAKTPMVTTIHGFSSPKIIPVYKRYNAFNHYVSISNADRSSELKYIATVYNGIDSSQFTLNEHREDYLLFFGRIHPDKGTHEAIEIAKKAGMKLIIAGIVQDRKYFEEKMSVAESMFCGTPVIAFNRGSMPELIRDGKTGFLVRNTDEAVDRLADIPKIRRADCRKWAEENFSMEKMIEGYLSVYEKVLGGQSHRH